MQQRASLFLTSKPTESDVRQHKVAEVTAENVLPCTVYLAVRHCISPEWTNNKDEFRYPNDGWGCDQEFLGDCLIWACFDNSVKSSDGPNHWIPFTEAEVDAKECFLSHFMSDLLAGKGGGFIETALPGLEDGRAASTKPPRPTFSPAARAVLDAGRELWRYYHAQPHANPNASYYDIRRHFQGMKTTAKGKEQMNPTSTDERYNALLSTLRAAMKKLAAQIEPKVYEYGFLRK